MNLRFAPCSATCHQLVHQQRQRRRSLLCPREAQRLFALALATVLFWPAYGQSQSSSNCQPIASLPPMATFGGPATVERGRTELGLAFGGFGELLPDPCIHAGGLDWLLRFRRGMSNRFDLGFDTELFDQTDGSLGITAKAAARFRVTHGFRLEAGVGASDQGDGGAVNADFAGVVGTHHPEKIWNYYMSLRLGASRGLCEASSCRPGSGNHLPGALVPLGVIGTTARVSDNVHFVMEAGLGEIFSREYSTSAPYIHLSFGVLVDVGQGSK